MNVGQILETHLGLPGILGVKIGEILARLHGRMAEDQAATRQLEERLRRDPVSDGQGEEVGDRDHG